MKKILLIIKKLITIDNDIDEKSLAGLLLVGLVIVFVIAQIIYTMYKGVYVPLMSDTTFGLLLAGGLGCLGVSGYFNNKNVDNEIKDNEK